MKETIMSEDDHDTEVSDDFNDVEETEISERSSNLGFNDGLNCNANVRRVSFDCRLYQDLKVYRIYHLARSGVQGAVEKWLAEKNVEIDCRTLAGKSALRLSMDGSDVIAEGILRHCGASDECELTLETDLAISTSIDICVEQVYQASLSRSGAGFVRTVCGLLDVAVDSRNGYGESALLLAVKAGNCSAVDALLEAGATVDREVLDISNDLSSERCFSRLLMARPIFVLEKFLNFMIFIVLSVCHLMNVHYYAS